MGGMEVTSVSDSRSDIKRTAQKNEISAAGRGTPLLCSARQTPTVSKDAQASPTKEALFKINFKVSGSAPSAPGLAKLLLQKDQTLDMTDVNNQREQGSDSAVRGRGGVAALSNTIYFILPYAKKTPSCSTQQIHRRGHQATKHGDRVQRRRGVVDLTSDSSTSCAFVQNDNA